ncbi:DNA-binding protein EMBP-1-like isoform X2 [Triticum dicoccoides]|uniref:DNA-binding protein EMBP-1-like isoform X2 n=1 Tax=Triticum dicoccoides TaxID=85692 RepID=UPI0018916ADF|nr:DNA-binding protein EMBP-1-like isoform X2 [Triticum dicoccoides]
MPRGRCRRRPRTQQHGLVAAGPGAAYGAPVSFLMYHHPAAAYYAHAHASMVAGVPYMAGESVSAAGKGKRVGKTRCVPSGEINFSSGSGDAGSQGSLEKGDTGANQKGSSSSAKRRKSGAANTEGEPSQAATVQNAVTEPPLEDKERSTSKLLVLAPGRAALTSAAPNLNIGMDPLSASPSSIVQGEVNAAASSQSNASLSQMQECEELAQKVSELTAANGTLRSELGQLKDCKTMETENKQLMQSEGPSVVTTLSIQVEAPEPHPDRSPRLPVVEHLLPQTSEKMCTNGCLVAGYSKKK